MKFLCENCKAKYQIADDKVAGRTVRMKCRKCAHLIEVTASVTETSVASKLPQEASTGLPPAAGAARPEGAQGTAHTGSLPPPRAPGAPGRPPPRPAVPAPRSPPPPKPAPPPGAGGLAGAFSKAVIAPPAEAPSAVSAAMAVLSTSSNTEEWYVGINGVPVGPVRLAELRRKAASGTITEESLVWREGFEEWVPLRTFPELSAMLKDTTSPRTSLTPTPPPAGAMVSRSMTPPAPRVPSPPGRQGPRPGLAQVAARSNVVPISSRRATAEKLEGLGETDPAEALDLEDAEASPEGAAAPAALAAAHSATEITDDELRRSGVGASERRRRVVHPAAWAMVGLLGVLVGMSLFLFVTPKEGRVQVVSVMVPAAPTPPPASSDSDETATSIGPIEIGVPTKAGGSGTRTKTAEPPAANTPAPPVNPSLSGLSGLLPGPQVAGPGKAAGSGGQLATADLERVVQSHRPFVKRQCWDPALGARPPNAPSSARVMVSVDVASDGHVQSATATGGDGYPGLASCVQGQVKNWRFPPSDGGSFKVPFIFAAQ